MAPETEPLPPAVPGAPPDDPRRFLAHARPNEDAGLRHIGLAGDTYTILLAGKDTGGRYCLIDMHVPPKGGPGPHRHDFEEMFTVLDGEIVATFRGEPTVVRSGETINIPANAPHSFTNASDKPARLLCMCSPPGQEDFFTAIGVPVEGRTAPPPMLSSSEQVKLMRRAEALAPSYRTEFVKP